MQEGVLCAVVLCESGQIGPSSHRPRRKLGQAATRSGSWIALQICPFRHRPISQQNARIRYQHKGTKKLAIWR